MTVPDTVAALGEPIALGRTAQIYALPGQRVLKLYLAGEPASDVTTEQTNCDEAVAAGLTPLACHELVRIEGRLGLVFDAADGRSLNSVAERNLLRLREVGRILAREHARVHQFRTTEHAEIRVAAADLLDRPVFEYLGAQRRERLAARLAALPAGDALLHMDFHTQNVFAHAGDWAIIDWQTSMRGAPAGDVAATMLLLRDAELWPGTPRLKQLLYDTVRRALAAAYLKEYLAVTGLTAEEVDRWRIAALTLRMGNWAIPSEQGRFGAELAALLEDPA